MRWTSVARWPSLLKCRILRPQGHSPEDGFWRFRHADASRRLFGSRPRSGSRRSLVFAHWTSRRSGRNCFVRAIAEPSISLLSSRATFVRRSFRSTHHSGSSRSIANASAARTREKRIGDRRSSRRAPRFRPSARSRWSTPQASFDIRRSPSSSDNRVAITTFFGDSRPIPPTQLVADPPFRAVAGVHPYLLPFGRRILAPNGKFGGAIVATVIPDELRDVFRAADIGERGVVTVFHRDGFVVFREPSEQDPIGEVAARQPLFEAARNIGVNDVYRGQAAPNGPMLRTAYRSLADRDLIVAVSLGEDELLREWRHDAIISGVIGLLFVTALAAILFLIFREMDTRFAAEEALSRSQRLESIGRLTGGIAHDFNNLLTVILGNVALIQDGLGRNPPEATAESAAQIERAASRGTALIRQLLAFARRRPLQSRTVDLVALIADSKPMLDRILGEDVTLELHDPAGRQFFATVDPTGMESALLNLCINARDAMPNGGTISIDLSSVLIDEQDAREQSDVGPGRYVVVRVQDNGAGIPPEHIPHLFEPFFTTKDVGRPGDLPVLGHGRAKRP